MSNVQELTDHAWQPKGLGSDNAKRSNEFILWKIGILLLPATWLLIAGTRIWHFAWLEREPPVFDALSYAQKANAFWHAISLGRPFNPLNVPPDIRPFGTVFFTYPFGFHYTFGDFYFLTNFLPLIFIYAAIYNVFHPLRGKTLSQIFVFSVMLIAATSLPPVFQFALAPNVNVISTWGYVDLVFASLAALSVSFLVKIHRRSYVFDTVCAALVAIATIFVKPTGMVVMAAIYGSSILISIIGLSREQIRVKQGISALAWITLLYLIVGLLLYKSAYFSPANMAYGESSLRLLHNSSAGWSDWSRAMGKVWVSFGPIFLIMLFVGLVASFSRNSWHLGALALVCVAGGAWLWLGRTNVDVARYFFPFPVMAAMFVIPDALRVATPRNGMQYGLLMFGVVPALLISFCLYFPGRAQKLESWLGLNLSVNVNQAVVDQAETLALAISRTPKKKFIVYYVGESGEVRAFEAVMDWRRIMGLDGGNTIPALPIDWVREAAYRFNELIKADFIVFQPISGAESYLDAHHHSSNYDEEEMLVRAWLTSLTTNDGIIARTEGETNVIKVTDRAKLWDSMEKLVANRSWPRAFTDGFTYYHVVDAPSIGEVSGNLIDSPIHLFDGSQHVADILALIHVQTGAIDRFSVYVKQFNRPRDPAGPWTVFAHRLSNGSSLTGAYVPYLSDSADDNYVIIYNLAMPDTSNSKHDSLGIGVYKPIGPGQADTLTNPGNNTDWGGKRTIVPLSSGGGT